ncbi:MAG: TetR/AcrR family transcriptional regulator C-terminal domain-containing protein [Eubacteriales bacterium]
MYTNKEYIAKTYIELLKSKSYVKITTEMICKKVPISRTTFYNYFYNQDSLSEWICEQDFMVNAFPTFQYYFGKMGMGVFFEYIKNNANFYTQLYHINDGVFLQRCLMKAYGACLTKEKLKTYSHPTKNKMYIMNSDVYKMYAHSGIASVVTYWIGNEMKIPVEQMANDLWIMIEHPLGYVRDNYLEIENL